MSKQHVNTGSIVDDYTGDYLRKGGIKINDNFDEIYDELGDTNILHPAGAWKTFTAVTSPSPTDNKLYIDFGAEYCIDTRNGSVDVYLPKVSDNPVGRVIKICDPHGSWSLNPVRVNLVASDSINGASVSPAEFNKNFQMVSFMSSDTDDWKYIDGTYLNRIDTSQKTVTKLSYILPAAPSGKFTISTYSDPNAVNVYLNGVMLYYSSDSLGPTGTSEYGSAYIDDGSPADGLLPLLDANNLDTIQLRHDIFKEGDVVTVEIFSSDYTPTRTSYKRSSLKVVDNDGAAAVGQSANLLPYFDGTAFVDVPLSLFGWVGDYGVLPSNFQFFYNGTLLNKEGTADLPASGNSQYKLNYNAGIYDTVSFTLPYTYVPDTTDVEVRYFTSAGDVEGNTITHYVVFNQSSDVVFNIPFSVADNTAVGGMDYNNDPLTYVYSDGVTFDNVLNELIIPNGVLSFSIGITTTDDTVHGSALTKTYTLTLGGDIATGTIYDADPDPGDTLPTLPYGTPVPDAADWGNDTLTVVSFANVLGTLLEWDGIDGILSLGNDTWVMQNSIPVSNSMSYSSQLPPNEPGYVPSNDEIRLDSANTVVNDTPMSITVTTALDIMNAIYPVGTIYSNASNPNNPATYLGFGSWRKYGAGMFSVGHSSIDTRFNTTGLHQNLNGGTLILNTDNLPLSPVDPTVANMTLDDSGEIPISACVPDPSSPTANPASLTAVTATIGSITPTPINTLPPYMVEYKWVRVA